MSLDETLQLLQQHGLVPNKLLGQNFMVDPSIYFKLAQYAALDSADVVLDAGAGFGFLTRFLAGKCKQVLAVEKDLKWLRSSNSKPRDYPNITVFDGDSFRKLSCLVLIKRFLAPHTI
jgi:16S rRNA (adenine1518-N6/adenine1519-N6)-dimethyltransferase